MLRSLTMLLRTGCGVRMPGGVPLGLSGLIRGRGRCSVPSCWISWRMTCLPYSKEDEVFFSCFARRAFLAPALASVTRQETAAVAQNLTLDRSERRSPAAFRFTGGKSGTAARYMLFFNSQWALMEQKRGWRGRFFPLV